MALELHIVGPGLELTRLLRSGEAPLTLGRDADCSVCLPDPDRNVSRRHLSVWNDAEELRFQVLSVVNGVELSDGDVPPGGSGVLNVGDALRLSGYRLSVSMVSADDPEADDPEAHDPWAELDSLATRPAQDSQDTVAADLGGDDDPFGDWGFTSTFGPGAPGGGLQADGLVPATDLKPFLAGLGMEPAREGAMTRGELETIGRLTRLALVGLLQAAQVARATRQQLQVDDGTQPGQRDANPLRGDQPPDAKLPYLFGGRAAGVGFMPPDRAVQEVVAELLAHQRALGEATRLAVDGTVGEFDPEALKARLLGTGARLFESARAWDAFVKDYQEQVRLRPQWVQRLLDRHFAEAYLDAFSRGKRDNSSRSR